MRRMRGRLLALVFLVAMGGVVPTAWAGNLVVTGHDTDFHACYTTGSQNLFDAFTGFARNGSALPILLVDRASGGCGGVGEAVHAATIGVIPFVLADPTAATFDTLLNGLNTTTYSALVVASAESCGGCDLSLADLQRLDTHATGVQDFFNAGGGIFLNTGGTSAAEQAAMYALTPSISATLPIDAFNGFSLTSAGQARFPTLSNADVNGNETHNQFTGFSSALEVDEVLTSGSTVADITLSVAGGGISGGTITAPEPSAVILVGTALMGLVGMKRFVGKSA